MQAEDNLTVAILTDRFDQRLVACLESIPHDWPIMLFATGIEPSKINQQDHPRLSMVKLPPVSDFSQARNNCLQHIKTEWVLFLDSDEVLQPFNDKTFEQLLQKTPAAGLTVVRSDIFHGTRLRYGEAGKQHLIRLMKPRQAQFVGTVHEVAHIDGSVTQSPLLLLHHSHDSVTEFMSKILKYAQLSAAQREYAGWRTWLELLLFPPGKFVWNFGCQLGFLDGWRGLVYAVLMSLHSTCVRLFLIEKHLITHDQTTH